MTSSPRGLLAGLLALLVVGGVAGALVVGSSAPQEDGSSASSTAPRIERPTVMTLTGQSVCLPHKNASGPQTTECALGIRTDAGVHYALDLQRLSMEDSSRFQTGQRITVQGIVIPLMMISADSWSTYDIEGIVQVATMTNDAVEPLRGE